MTSAWKMITGMAPAMARAMMPLENTSRWPRLVSCLGMKASLAWKLANRGKSAKLVLAASTRINMVAAWVNRNRAWPTAPLPYTAWAAWAMTVLESLGTTCILAASQEMPRNMEPSRTAMMTSVWRACFHSTGLKAGTPLEMASTPVMAAPPEAKACRISTTLAAPVASSAAGWVGTTWDRPPPNKAL